MAALKDETGGVAAAGVQPCEKLNFPPSGTLNLPLRSLASTTTTACRTSPSSPFGLNSARKKEIQPISYRAPQPEDDPCFLLLLLTSNDVNTITSTWTALQRWHCFQTMRLILRCSGRGIQIAYVARLFLIYFDLDSCWAMSFLRLWCSVLRIRCCLNSCRISATYQWL